MKRLRTTIRIIAFSLLVPIIHFVYVLLLSIRENTSFEDAKIHFAADLVWISLAPVAVIQGRFPSLLELARLPLPQLALRVLTVFVVWVLAGQLIWLVWKHTSPRWRWLSLGILLVVSIVWTALPRWPSPTFNQIRVDASQSAGTMPDNHRGFSQGGEIEMREAGFFESAMNQMRDLNPRLMRIDHIYDYYDVYSMDADGVPQYDWTELDRIIDAVYLSGAEPFISVSYMPPALARDTVYGPPHDLALWQELVYQTVYHLNVEREFGIRYWEVWNEPNLAHFWNGTLDEYLQLYEATARGALRADSSIKIGGPATASNRNLGAAFPWYNERNWITELARFTQANGLPLDFVSWHLYDPRVEQYKLSVTEHESWLGGLNPKPLLLLTEWNYNAGFTPTYEDGRTSAFVAATVAALTETPLKQAFYFEPIDGGTGGEGRWGLMNRDGRVKPIFEAFRLLNALSGERLFVQTSHPNSGALATRNDHGVDIIIWNYASGHTALSIELTIEGLSASTPINTIYQDLNAGEQAKDSLSLETSSSGELALAFDLQDNGLRLIGLKMLD